MRSAPKSPTPTFDPPLDAWGSELSSAGRIIALRQTCEVVAPYFWKRDEMFEFRAKSVHKVPKSCRIADSTGIGTPLKLLKWKNAFLWAKLTKNQKGYDERRKTKFCTSFCFIFKILQRESILSPIAIVKNFKTYFETFWADHRSSETLIFCNKQMTRQNPE